MPDHSAPHSIGGKRSILIETEPKPGTGYTLQRMQTAVERLGHPERNYKVVHVGGTSGKGSTCAMIASILQAAGYSVGLYTSPALQSPWERITVNGKMITEKTAKRMANSLGQMTKEIRLTDFEKFTLLAFQYFSDRQVDYAVIEVGIGGKFDATNVVQPTVAIVTDVGLDHMELLGKTKALIAKDKQAIIKPGCIGLTGSRLIKRGTYINLEQAKILSTTLQGTIFSYKHWKQLQLKMVGVYQVRNAVLAIEATSRLGIGSAAIKYGLHQVKQRGRFEVISKKPLIIMDGAHNPQKMAAFISSLKQLVPLRQKRAVCLCAIKKTKDIQNTLKPLLPLLDTIIFTTFPNSHNLAVLEQAVQRCHKEKSRKIKIKKIGNPQQAYRVLCQQLQPTDLGIITGSLYLIGKLLPKL